MPIVDFIDLPAITRQKVTRHTGAVRSIRPMGTGCDHAVAVILSTQSGPVFLKGIRADHPRAGARWREAVVGPYLPAVAPRLLWHEEAGGWLLVAWEAVQGRHADYRVAADLQLVLAALEDVQRDQAPAEVVLETAVERWGRYADEGDAELFAGDALLHTGWAPDNVLVDGRRVHLANWAGVTRGAGWIDPYLWALRLMEAGHTAASAVEWVCEVPSWREGGPAAIKAFGAAVARAWQEIAEASPTARAVHMAVQAAELRAYLTLDSGAAKC